MSLNDVAAIANVVGVMLVVIFTVRWGARAPRNTVIGNIGIVMIVAASVTRLALWFSGRT